VCNGVRIDIKGTVITDNKMGNFSNSDTQISCTDCPGCENSEVGNNDLLLWLLVLLIIPIAICGCAFMYKSRLGYKALSK